MEKKLFLDYKSSIRSLSASLSFFMRLAAVADASALVRGFIYALRLALVVLRSRETRGHGSLLIWFELRQEIFLFFAI